MHTRVTQQRTWTCVTGSSGRGSASENACANCSTHTAAGLSTRNTSHATWNLAASTQCERWQANRPHVQAALGHMQEDRTSCGEAGSSTLGTPPSPAPPPPVWQPGVPQGPPGTAAGARGWWR